MLRISLHRTETGYESDLTWGQILKCYELGIPCYFFYYTESEEQGNAQEMKRINEVAYPFGQAKNYLVLADTISFYPTSLDEHLSLITD